MLIKCVRFCVHFAKIPNDLEFIFKNLRGKMRLRNVAGSLRLIPSVFNYDNAKINSSE